MMTQCEAAGNREKCSLCSHSKPHKYNEAMGCNKGECHPRNVVEEDGIKRQVPFNPNCVEIREENVKTSGDTVEVRGTEEPKE